MKQIIRRVAALVIGLGLGAVALAGLESVTHISDLNASWPLGSDLASTSDDHIRNIKTALKTDFPNINAAVTATPAQLNTTLNLTASGSNLTASGTLTANSFIPSSSTVPTNGVYLPAANTLGFATNSTKWGSVNSTGNWAFVSPAAGPTLTVNAPANSRAIDTIDGTSTLDISTDASHNWYFGPVDAHTLNLQTNSIGTARVAINSSGNVTVNAPSSGTALAITGVAASYTASLTGASGQAAHLALIDGNTGNRPWELRVGQIGTGVFDIFDGTANASRLQINTSGTITALGSVAASQVDMTPDTGTFTSTYTGFTAGVTCTSTWSRIGKLVLLALCSATGTSNASTFTMTGLPSAIQPSSLTQWVAITAVEDATLTDNGNDAAVITASSGTVQFALHGSLSTWTSSGTKGFTHAITVPFLLN